MSKTRQRQTVAQIDRWAFSNTERVALEASGYEAVYPPEEKIPAIVVNNFPTLGRLAAVRFLEWALENPEGVVSLPTGKTPEYFIKYVLEYLDGWNHRDTREALEEMGLATDRKPDLAGLRFVQIDEFYPINPKQHNSFCYYVNKYYLKGFGMDASRAMLIDPSTIGLPRGVRLQDIFPKQTLDLSLRVRRATSLLEKRQQEVLWAADQFCTDYERRIRELGGLGFFLGGIGPDGHIAFNIRGSDHFSTTRLIEANYETKATAAADLGGMEVARHKNVITIGLATIAFNKDVVAIIIAAGEAKAKIVARTMQHELSNTYPGSVLAALPGARFYLTRGAAAQLDNRRLVDFTREERVSPERLCRMVVDLSLARNTPIENLTEADFREDRFTAELMRKTGSSVADLKDAARRQVVESLQQGHKPIEHKTLLHTAPHHDDIILAYLPYVTNIVRRSSTRHYFAYMTSGFNAVTNHHMRAVVEDLLARLERREFAELLRTDYFDPANMMAKRLDSAHFLQGAARHHEEKQDQATARRLLRNMIELYEDDSIDNIKERLGELCNYFRTQYPGKKDMALVQQLKGRMREWESDLKWAYYGFTGETVRHLRLGFYKGDIFTEPPRIDRDVPPIVRLLFEVEPDIVSVAFDPEGSGPDTHYKVLQAVAQALRTYEERSGRHDVEVLGYRNVWFRFHPSEANLYVPTSLTHLNDMEAAFDTCFATQRTASFPSHEYDGPFSRLARKIQAKQYEQVKALLGEDFFVCNEDHGLRACCGIVYLRRMDLAEFYTRSEELKQIAEDV